MSYKVKMTGLFHIRICNMSNISDVSMEEYLRRLQQMNCLKGEVHSERFFRNMCEIALERTLASGKLVSGTKAPNPGAGTAATPAKEQQPVMKYDYTAIDGFC